VCKKVQHPKNGPGREITCLNKTGKGEKKKTQKSKEKGGKSKDWKNRTVLEGKRSSDSSFKKGAD